MAKLAFNGRAGEGNTQGVDRENTNHEGSEKGFGEHHDKEEW